MPMTKTQIVAQLAARPQLPKSRPEQSCPNLRIGRQGHQKGDKFAIPGFVTVKVRARKARIGRNPQTGAAIKIPARRSSRPPPKP